MILRAADRFLHTDRLVQTPSDARLGPGPKKTEIYLTLCFVVWDSRLGTRSGPTSLGRDTRVLQGNGAPETRIPDILPLPPTPSYKSSRDDYKFTEDT